MSVHSKRSLRPGLRGFTLIEVLIAASVSAIGFAAIFSLQIGSMQGNIDARDMSAAVNLGERAIEMLRRESYAWTSGNDRPAPWLNRTDGEWHSLTSTPVDHNLRPHESADANGTPLARQRFCVHYRMSPLTGSFDGVIDLDVRVIWPKGTLDTGTLVTDKVCSEPDDFEPDVTKWLTYSIPASLRRHGG